LEVNCLKVKRRNIETDRSSWTPCPVCGKLKKPKYKVCSHECFHINNRKVDWDNIDLLRLYEDNGRSFVTLFKILKVSDSVIGRNYNKLIKLKEKVSPK
jgi:hypothetical protein